MPDIIVDRDYVRIEGVIVQRPSRISPSQWLDFWRGATDSYPDSSEYIAA